MSLPAITTFSQTNCAHCGHTIRHHADSQVSYADGRHESERACLVWVLSATENYYCPCRLDAAQPQGGENGC